jgi:hypothetical protein
MALIGPLSEASRARRPLGKARVTFVLGLGICCAALAQTVPVDPAAAAAPAQPTAKQLFANTLAAVAASAGTVILANLQQGLTDWFARKQGAAVAQYPPAAASAAYPPATSAAAAYPPAATAYQVPAAPAPPSAGPTVTYYEAAPAIQPAVHAGLAYEIHLLLAGGATQAVDPASHVFATGDRFVVYYRPTLPGQVQVYNVNPLGSQSLIDEAAVAAADLARLGPYEFTATKGDEQLRVVLQPCSTPAMSGTTRDIVRVADGGQPAASGYDAYPAAAAPPAIAPALGIAPCAAVTARSLGRTRDIRKVAVDGTTGYALDPLSPQEVASGYVDAREVTVVLRHR